MTSNSLELAMPEIDWGYDLIVDMPERLASLEEQGKRCVPIRYKGGVAWLVVGYDSVEQVFRDEAGIPAHNFNRAYMDAVGFSLFHLEGVEHKAFKTAVLSLLSALAAKRLTPKLLMPLADQLIDEFGSDREVEFLIAFGRRYGFNVMTRLTGLTVAREDEAKVQAVVNELSQIQDPHASREELRERALVAKARVNEMLRPLLERRRKEPGEDLMTSIINLNINGRTLNDDEVLDFTRHLIEGGAASTGLQLGNILNAILRDPGIKDMVLSNPDKRGVAIDELLRLEPIVGLISRRTTNDTEIAGTLVPAASLVLLGVPGANRSESRFKDPNRFSLDKRARPPLTFGAGVRMCPGQHLARQELKVAMDRLLDRLPGLRLAGKPSRQGGSQARWLQDGLKVAFDQILPADSVAPRN